MNAFNGQRLFYEVRYSSVKNEESVLKEWTPLSKDPLHSPLYFSSVNLKYLLSSMFMYYFSSSLSVLSNLIVNCHTLEYEECPFSYFISIIEGCRVVECRVQLNALVTNTSRNFHTPFFSIIFVL